MQYATINEDCQMKRRDFLQGMFVAAVAAGGAVAGSEYMGYAWQTSALVGVVAGVGGALSAKWVFQDFNDDEPDGPKYS